VLAQFYPGTICRSYGAGRVNKGAKLFKRLSHAKALIIKSSQGSRTVRFMVKVYVSASEQGVAS